jgi:hypothetical protein
MSVKSRRNSDISEENTASFSGSYGLPLACADFLLGLLFHPEDGCYVPPKRQAQSELHSITIQKTALFKI